MIKSKKYGLLTLKMLISSTLMVWPQLRTNSAQSHCIPSLTKISETMESTEPLIINESLIIEDIKKAYKALATPGNTPRSIASQFGTIDANSTSENEVKPFNSDLDSLFVYSDVINFNFRPHSLISLSVLQKAFGSYAISVTRTNRTGSMTTYSIRFIADPKEVYGKQILIYVHYTSSDLKAEKIEVVRISVVG